jgi:hypothetical protein
MSDVVYAVSVWVQGRGWVQVLRDVDWVTARAGRDGLLAAGRRAIVSELVDYAYSR